MHRRPFGTNGNVLVALAVLIAVICGFVAVAVLLNTTQRMGDALSPTTAVERDDNAPFVKVWSVSLRGVLEMATVPGRRGEFYALHDGQIYRFDSAGQRLEQFAAPPKSSRLSTDRTGRLPLLLVVSRKTKWTGAITHVDTTDYFLHALTAQGQVAWSKRFDPDKYSTLEPIVARSQQRPMVVLSASKRLAAFDASGTLLWDVDFWHHPGSVAVADLNGDGEGELLAAKAPMQPIMRISDLGSVIGPWGTGEGPDRVRTMHSRTTGLSAVSVRRVFGRGRGGTQTLTFFDYAGTTVGEVDLPQDASTLSYSPITALDLDGRGERIWVVALGDGSVHAYSPAGASLAQYHTGIRPRTYLAVPQSSGPDLLVMASDGALTAWRPVAARLSRPFVR